MTADLRSIEITLPACPYCAETLKFEDQWEAGFVECECGAEWFLSGSLSRLPTKDRPPPVPPTGLALAVAQAYAPVLARFLAPEPFFDHLGPGGKLVTPKMQHE